MLLATEYGSDGFHLMNVGIGGLDSQSVAAEAIIREVLIAQIHPAHVELLIVKAIYITEIAGIAQT